ncbi:uncharacterized protein PGTG_17171 [Puccinia graminis f. sp. tritici CRL 75-36-700-3]|uniref:Uncharacterized protein n=1 Tax=Puccinia graminis f. sp. tritici (strain CRL 75-36-700-3 / race SCCL) TaxID=418459 RepID=E3L439_PUCGT|nr:uncharacterized protein PGTG_17171 [Puccinia graminis f. sp. tritici CRL 75-36-700-3]EFP91314.1 hypothetical protein PGTG_17171 [Puccinia graminis f. sp. tritici CRL 75-36-700-3]
MPHPIVFAAGMAIIVGAGYVIYTELNRKSDEEEAYQTYCATIRAEKESRNRRLQGLRDAELDDKAQQSSSSLKNIHHTSLRHRSTNQSTPQEKMDYPLIDLGQQFYPPIPRSHRSTSPSRSSSSSNSHLNKIPSFNPILDIPIPDPVIFIAPSLEESVEAEGSASRELQDSTEALLSQDQDQSTDVSDETPLIDWKPQEESTTLGRLLGLEPQDSDPLQPASMQASEQPEYSEEPQRSQTDREADQSPCQLSAPSSPKSPFELPVPQLPVDTSFASDSDDWSVADEPVQTSTNSPSLDGNWSDLGSDSFERI